MFILRTMYPCGLNRKGGGGVEALLKMIKIQSGLKVIMALQGNFFPRALRLFQREQTFRYGNEKEM